MIQAGVLSICKTVPATGAGPKLMTRVLHSTSALRLSLRTTHWSSGPRLGPGRLPTAATRHLWWVQTENEFEVCSSETPQPASATGVEVGMILGDSIQATCAIWNQRS